MAKAVALPPGFEIDALPEGFVVDEPSAEGAFSGGSSVLNTTGPAQGPINVMPTPDTRGVRQLGATLGASAFAEPAAGIAGSVAGLVGGSEAAAATVGGVRERLGIPLGPEGAAMVQSGVQAIPPQILSALESMAGRFNDFADLTAEALGPAAGAAVKALPTALAEVAGFKGASAVLRRSNTSLGMSKARLGKELKDLAPSIDELEQAAKAAYRSVDESGVVVNPSVTRVIAANSKRALERITGEQRRRAPAIWREIDDLVDAVNTGSGFPVDELVRMRDQLSTIALNRTDNQSKAAANVLDVLDDALDGLSTNSMAGANTRKVGEQLRTARELFRRAKRAEAVEKAIEDGLQARSGAETGIRNEFGKLRRSKNFKRFTAEEQALIKEVERGGFTVNTLRKFGRFGFGEGASSSIMGLGAGAGIGFVVGGQAGAVVLPVIGMISRPLAARMTQGNAQFALDVIKAGRDSRRVVASYMAHTPTGKRNPADLAQLLMNPKLDLGSLTPGGQPLISQARTQALINRARITQAAAAAATGSAASSQQQ